MIVQTLFRYRLSLVFLAIWIGSVSLPAADDSPADPSRKEPVAWDIENAPGRARSQPIDTTEGTWINLDVSPSGKQLVFDLLGDLYLMPITSTLR